MMQRAQVNIGLKGTPEQIRMAYRHLLDTLDDITDIYRADYPEWSCHMIFDLDEDHRKPRDRRKDQEFLMADVEGCNPRT